MKQTIIEYQSRFEVIIDEIFERAEKIKDPKECLEFLSEFEKYLPVEGWIQDPLENAKEGDDYNNDNILEYKDRYTNVCISDYLWWGEDNEAEDSYYKLVRDHFIPLRSVGFVLDW